MNQTQYKNTRGRHSLTIAVPLLIFLCTGIDAEAFEAIVTNERSGNVIHVDSQGSTTHLAAVCNRPRGMTKGLDDSHVIIACSDDDKVISYNRKTRSVETEIKSVTGAMNCLLYTSPSPRDRG